MDMEEEVYCEDKVFDHDEFSGIRTTPAICADCFMLILPGEKIYYCTRCIHN